MLVSKMLGQRTVRLKGKGSSTMKAKSVECVLAFGFSLGLWFWQ